MNNVVTVPQGYQLPAVLQGLYKPGNKDLSQGVGGVPVLSIRGRAFRFKWQGNETLVTMTGNDGQQWQAPYLDVIIIMANPNMSKIFYPGAYVEGSDDPPVCWSLDGIRPDASVPQKQAAACGVCPNNVWGSKTTLQGRPTKACADGRRLAIVPAGDPMNAAFGGVTLLRVPPASLQELAAYGNGIEAGGMPYYGVVTRLSFDQQEAYPRLEFQCIAGLNEQQAAAVAHWLNGAGAQQTQSLLFAAEISAPIQPQAQAQPQPMQGYANTAVAPPAMATPQPMNPYGVAPAAPAFAPVPGQAQYHAGPPNLSVPPQIVQTAPVAPPPPPPPAAPTLTQGADGNWWTMVNGQWQPATPPSLPPTQLQMPGVPAAPPPAASPPPTGTRSRGRPRATAAAPAIVAAPPVSGPIVASQAVSPPPAFVPPPPNAPLPPQPPAQAMQAPPPAQPVAPPPPQAAVAPPPVAAPNGSQPPASSAAPAALEAMLDHVLATPQ